MRESLVAAADGPRVLLVAPSIRIMGGQAVVAQQLLRDLRADGLRVGFQPINPRPPWPWSVGERVRYLRTLVVSVTYIAQLLLRVPRYDVIHVFSASYFSFIISQTPAILIARLFGKRIVLNYHSGQCEDHLNRWGRAVYWILRRVDQIVVQSEYLIEAFAKHGFSAIAIPNVVCTAEFRYRRREVFQPRILLPRMLESLYNIDCAIRAFEIVKQQIPAAQLTILGDGPEREALQRLVVQLGLTDVTFTGRVERASIPEHFDQHDLYLNTSSIDNMPVSVLEAFAAGLPVVTTAAGGIPWMVRDGQTGYLAPIDDHRAIADRILEVCRNPRDSVHMTDRAFASIDQYQWPQVAERWYALYRRLKPPAVAKVPSFAVTTQASASNHERL